MLLEFKLDSNLLFSVYVEHESFRAYAAILYMNQPRMKIYLRGKKVQIKLIERALYKPCFYKYLTTKFKSGKDNEIKQVEVKVSQCN